jgi:hypothetical protein
VEECCPNPGPLVECMVIDSIHGWAGDYLDILCRCEELGPQDVGLL